MIPHAESNLPNKSLSDCAMQSSGLSPYTSWSFHVSGGTTLHTLGAATRANALAGIQFSWVQPHLFRAGRHKSTIVQELFYEHSQWRSKNSPSNYNGVGYLAGLRYDWGVGSYKVYTGFGSGFFYAPAPSEDLPARLNFSPYIDAGVVIPNGKHPVSLGLRFLHHSNGGTVSPNPGQNQLFFDVGIRL